MKKSKVKIAFVIAIFAIALMFIFSKQILMLIYPTKYSMYVELYSKKYNIDKYLIYSIIKTESKFDENAVSYKNAKGLMQITDITANWANEELKIESMNIFDPNTNINIGTWYLDKLRDEFNGDIKLMIAAYNGGSGNVRKWLKNDKYSSDGKNLDNIPFKETSGYTEKVLKNYKIYKKIYSKSV